MCVCISAYIYIHIESCPASVYMYTHKDVYIWHCFLFLLRCRKSRNANDR